MDLAAVVLSPVLFPPPTDMTRLPSILSFSGTGCSDHFPMERPSSSRSRRLDLNGPVPLMMRS